MTADTVVLKACYGFYDDSFFVFPNLLLNLDVDNFESIDFLLLYAWDFVEIGFSLRIDWYYLFGSRL